VDSVDISVKTVYLDGVRRLNPGCWGWSR